MFSAEFWPGLEQELRSFKLWETLPLDKFERTDFPQLAPLFAFANSLTFLTEWTPAFSQQLGSFRSTERDRLNSQWHSQPDFSWLHDVIPLTDAELITAVYNRRRNRIKAPANRRPASGRRIP